MPKVTYGKDLYYNGLCHYHIVINRRMDKLQAVKNEKENQKDTISLCPTKTRTDGTARG